jgi:hypothetical protein
MPAANMHRLHAFVIAARSIRLALIASHDEDNRAGVRECSGVLLAVAQAGSSGRSTSSAGPPPSHGFPPRHR